MNETIAFNQYQRLLAQLANKCQRQYGGSFDDLYQDACVYFLHAVRTHDASRSKLCTWIYHQVWGRLRTDRRREQVKHINTRPLDMLEIPFWHQSEEPSPDARKTATVALALTDSANEFGESIQGKNIGKKLGKRIRGEIKDRLQRCGWCAMRVAESFQEIVEIL